MVKKYAAKAEKKITKEYLTPEKLQEGAESWMGLDIGLGYGNRISQKDCRALLKTGRMANGRNCHLDSEAKKKAFVQELGKEIGYTD